MPVGVMLGLQDELTLTNAGFFPSDGHDVKSVEMKSILTRCASRFTVLMVDVLS